MNVSEMTVPRRLSCQVCDSDGDMFSINEAARIRQQTWRDIIGGMQSGLLHYVETENGEIYVCGRSLANAPKQIL